MDLLRRVQETGNPVIDGERVTFVWRGEEPPFLVGDFNGWSIAAAGQWMRTGDEVWTQEIGLPLDAYMEYAYLSEPRDEARVPDPHNDHTVPNGVGQNNHYFYMPEATDTPLAERAKGVPQGKISRHRIENPWFLAGGKRWVHLYQPAGGKPTPLLVVYDAQDYLTRGRITQIVDNLIHQKRIRPISLALLDNGGPARSLEYSCSESTIGLLMMELLPLAQKNLKLIEPGGGQYGVMGASMGGLMAVYTGLRVPEVFGKVLSQSGAFSLGEKEFVTTPLVRHLPVPPLKVWMDVGRYEWLLEPNRQFHGLLQERGYDVTYREYNGGHNYASWRNDFWRGLEVLFG